MKVSVIIITYNQERLIDRAIAGVMHQKGDFDVELIVCNDASTDGTLSRIKRWQRRYPENIRIINHGNNIGFRANYLSGFKAATGRYLAMCDADDYWTDASKLARQTAYMEAHPECAITFHRVVNVYSPSRVKTLSNGNQKADTTLADLSRSNYITNLSVMYRRGLVPPEKLPEWLATTALPDYAYHILYAQHGTIHYINRPMGVYSQNEAGAWSLSGEEKRLNMALDVRRNLMDWLPADSEAQEGLRTASANMLITMMAHAETGARRTDIRKRLDALELRLSEAEIDERVKRRRKEDNTGGFDVRNLLRRVYRQLTRLLPAPRPC